MPARTCGTARPTNGTRVVTLAPDWPVTGSIAHSENVEYLRVAVVVDGDAVGGALLRKRGTAIDSDKNQRNQCFSSAFPRCLAEPTSRE